MASPLDFVAPVFAVVLVFAATLLIAWQMGVVP